MSDFITRLAEPVAGVFANTIAIQGSDSTYADTADASNLSTILGVYSEDAVQDDPVTIQTSGKALVLVNADVIKGEYAISGADGYAYPESSVTDGSEMNVIGVFMESATFAPGLALVPIMVQIGKRIRRNIETITASSNAAKDGHTLADASGGDVEIVLGPGVFIGQEKWFIRTESGSNDFDVLVEDHADGDDTEFFLSAENQAVGFKWTGDKWITIKPGGVGGGLLFGYPNDNVSGSGNTGSIVSGDDEFYITTETESSFRSMCIGGNTGANQIGEAKCDIHGEANVSSTVFTGAGLNDLTTSFNGVTCNESHDIEVEIDATGTPDTFKYRVDGGSYTAGVAITGAAQSITVTGVGVVAIFTFAATTGHTIGNEWAWTTRILSPLRITTGQYGGGEVLRVGHDGNLWLSKSIVMEGTTDDDYKTTLSVTDPTADRTILLPNLSGTLLVGPGTVTDNALVRFDGTGGFTIQNSVVIADDSGNVTGVAALTMSGVLTVSSGGETLTITANSPANTVTYSTYPSANMVFVSGGNLDFDMYDSGTGAAKMRFLFGGADKGAYVDDLGEIVAKKFICSTGGETLTITANSPANAVTISCDPTSNLYIDSGGDMYFDIYATGAGTAKFRFTAGGSEKATIDDLGAAVFLSVSTGNGAVELYPSGTYTPTLTNVANVGASTAYSCQYHRVGDIVHVSGKVDVDPTTTLVLTQLGISLPIASNFANANECAGTAVAPAISGGTGCAAILGDATNNRAELQMTPVDVANQSFYFTFTYRVI